MSTSTSDPSPTPTITFHLVLSPSPSSFISTLKHLPPPFRPLWLGKPLHWIHEPHLSTTTLLDDETNNKLLPWTYLLVTTSPTLPATLSQHTTRHWSISTASPPPTSPPPTFSSPPLPKGWTPTDPSGLLAAQPPADLEASLALSARPLGNSKSTTPVILKDYISTRPLTPVAMFNLLAYLPDQRARYFEYMAAFQAGVGSKFGGEPLFVGLEVTDWTSKGDEGGVEGGQGWEDAALIWYPSIWHFGKMLDDEGYVDADRRYKQGVLRDNPILCCEEVEVEYVEV